MTPFSLHEPIFRRDHGGILTLLIPVLLILLLGFACTLKLTLQMQGRVATQARLDVCAVKITVLRKNALQRISQINKGVMATMYGVYAARGVKLVGPIGAALGGMSEAALLALNQSLGRSQNLIQSLTSLQEARSAKCSSSIFSAKIILCAATPNLSAALLRTQSLYPDLLGPMRLRSADSILARTYCESVERHKLKTTIAISGNPNLSDANFSDHYEE